jgi:uncharacterized protein (TIGR00730 family)
MRDQDSNDVDVSQEFYSKRTRATPQQMQQIDALLQKLIPMLSEVQEGDQVADIIEAAVKLLRDKTNRGDLKLIRTAMAELRYALKVFAPYRDTRKISVFGSARTPETEADYQAAVEFGRRMAQCGWMVTTGAGGGIMAAAHGGAGRDPSFGLAIRLPFEQTTNRYIDGDKKLVNFKYFFTRKLMFVRTSHAMAAFPGGFGTMDELFEVLTLVQTGKSVPMPIVLVDKKGGRFWVQWQQYIHQQLLGRKLISPADLSLYKITDNIETAVDEVCRFYRNYHSMRYYRDTTIIRLQHKPTDAQLKHLESNFADITSDGRFHAGPAHKVESDESDIAHLPRLFCKFNRHDQGRFRQMIDFLNQEG